MNQYLNKKFSNHEFLNLSKVYRSNEPYPHIVIDNFLDEKKLDSVTKKIDQIEIFENNKRFDPNQKRKLKSDSELEMPDEVIDIIRYFNSQTFLNSLQSLTGIKEKLLSDPYLWGGGIHRIKRGGFLKIHSDTNFHPDFNLDRRLNLLLYLNKNWNKEYGGELELWDKQMKKCVKKIAPLFNRAVIFSTDDTSYHGHPDPLDCPENVARQSLALYYYSHGRSDVKTDFGKGTYFKKRSSNFGDFVVVFKNFFEALMPPILLKFIYKYIFRYIKRG